MSVAIVITPSGRMAVLDSHALVQHGTSSAVSKRNTSVTDAATHLQEVHGPCKDGQMCFFSFKL